MRVERQVEGGRRIAAHENDVERRTSDEERARRPPTNQRPLRFSRKAQRAPARRCSTAPRRSATTGAAAASALGAPVEVARSRSSSTRFDDEADAADDVLAEQPRLLREQRRSSRRRRAHATAPGSSAGKMRRMRRAIEVEVAEACRRARPSKTIVEIRKPEMTKKTSTPTKPPRPELRERVVPDDREDREGAQAVDVGAVAGMELGVLLRGRFGDAQGTLALRDRPRPAVHVDRDVGEVGLGHLDDVQVGRIALGDRPRR